ncbi:MAG: hypothetical protein WAZ19_01890 [Anaerolineae bacterium]
MVTGLWNMVTDPVGTAKGLWYGITHPGELWDAIKQPYVEAWESGHPWEAIGRGTMAVVTTVLGTKGADKVAKVLKGATVADDVARVATVADDVARAGSVADDVARAGSIMDEAGRVAGIIGKSEDISGAFVSPAEVFGDLATRTTQRELDSIPGSILTSDIKEFVTPRIHGDFNQYNLGVVGDKSTKLLWTIDDKGAHFIPEVFEWNSSRHMPSHTNISESAYFAGEAWRTGPNEITINASSRAYGYNWQIAGKLTGDDLALYLVSTQARFDAAVEYFRKLGFMVQRIPFKQ